MVTPGLLPSLGVLFPCTPQTLFHWGLSAKGPIPFPKLVLPLHLASSLLGPWVNIRDLTLQPPPL